MIAMLPQPSCSSISISTNSGSSSSSRIERLEDLYEFLIYNGFVQENEFTEFRKMKNKIEEL